MPNSPILSFALWFPIIGGFTVLLCGFLFEKTQGGTLKFVSLSISFVSLILSSIPLIFFDSAYSGMQFVEKAVWIKDFDINYFLGIDGISIFFLPLTSLITLIVIISAWDVIRENVSLYLGNFLIMSGLLIGVFCALDGVLFYVFFEATLIPMYFIIGIWGGQNRIYAAVKFFLYTLLGSLLALVALIYLYITTNSFSILDWHKFVLDLPVQLYLFAALFLAFAVKIPMWPVHTWLPDAHVEAPTAGSVILAAILLKMAGYGFLRFSLPMFPLASEYFTPLIFTLSIIAIIYTSLVALMQEDMKKLIAYSSVAHMGFVTLGIFTMTQQGIEGSIFQMISHGLVSAALFLSVGVVYERHHTRLISRYGGLVQIMPKYATGGYTAPNASELQLTIGKLYVNTPMILTTLSYTYSDETPWDIDFGTPMGIDVQVGCTILGNELHQYDSQKVFVFDGKGKDFSSSLTSPAKTGEFRTPFTT